MNAVPFDTLDYFNQLTAVGVPKDQAAVQARAILHLIDEKLVTKSDFEDLRLATRKDIQELKISTKNDIEELRVSTTKDIEALRISTKHEIEVLSASTKHDIEALSASTKHDIKALSASTKRDIEVFTTSTKHELANLEHNIMNLEERLTYKLTIRLGGMITGAVTILAILIKLL